MRKKILKIYGAILLLGTLYYVWGETTGLYLSCFFYATTGLLCPGCGISRMFLALIRLDIPAAFGYNPVVFVLLILWNAIAVLCFWGKPAFVRDRRFLYGTLGVSVAALVVFGIVRNIP